MSGSAEGKASKPVTPQGQTAAFERRQVGVYSTVLRYAGDIARANLATLRVASAASLVILIAMLVQCCLMPDVLTSILAPFIFGLAAMAATLAIAHRAWPDDRVVAAGIAGTAVYAVCWYLIVFFFDAGIQPEKQCVMSCVAFVVIPALFDSHPADKICATAATLALFIVLELALVSPQVVTADIANATLSAIIGVGIGIHKSSVSEGRLVLLDMYQAATKASVWVSQQDLVTGAFMLLKVPSYIPVEVVEGKGPKEAARKVGEFIEDGHRDGFMEFIDPDTMAGRLEAAGGSVVYVCRDCEGHWLRITAVESARYKGKVVAVTFIADDVDDDMRKQFAYQQQLEDAALEAQRANAAKTSFLRRMSHDVRTPINGIRGELYIADQHPDDPEVQADCRRKIHGASDYLLSLSNNILDMSKLESGTNELEHVPFDLAQTLTSIAGVAATLASEHSLAFNIHGSADTLAHTRLVGSPKHLQQILTNLSGNSVKYTPAGGSITVECEEVSCDGKVAVIEFTCSDTGIGMSEEFQRRMFEPFSREERDESVGVPGSGLGLSIVHEIVEQMGGSIECTSVLGRGTSFHVRLPFELDTSAPAEEKASELPEVDLTGKRALLVEDNELNREIACFILEEEGLEVDWAENGKVGVEKFEASELGGYDIVFMDVMMPVMDGLTAARAIRALDRADARRVPIVAMTANAFMDDIQRSRDAGMDEHLAKPIELDRIHETLQRLLG